MSTSSTEGIVTSLYFGVRGVIFYGSNNMYNFFTTFVPDEPKREAIVKEGAE